MRNYPFQRALICGHHNQPKSPELIPLFRWSQERVGVRPPNSRIVCTKLRCYSRPPYETAMWPTCVGHIDRSRNLQSAFVAHADARCERVRCVRIATSHRRNLENISMRCPSIAAALRRVRR